MPHANAPLSVEGRRRLVKRCQIRPIAYVAAEMGVSRACVSKWAHRWRLHGDAGLQDRPSSRTGVRMRVDDAVRSRLRYPEQRGQLAQREVGPPVRDDQEDPVLQRQAPGPAPTDRVSTFATQCGDQCAD